ncbi:MAG TPA: DUF1425 domain-containing protein [Phycisphaerales bacterium]|nr:DUF1425 domain-containing protein [Phycisphaerales bacterium]
MASRTLMNMLAATISVGGLLGAAACQSSAPPYRGRVDPIPLSDYPQIVVTRPLNDLLGFSQPNVTPATETEPMRVVAPVRSMQDGYTRVQYQFEFFDERGRPLSQSGWKYKSITPRQQVFLDGRALSTEAKDWRLSIRQAG